MMKVHPMIAVKDVEATSLFYQNLLGAVSAHGGNEYDQLMVGSRLVLQLHDCRPDANHGPLRDLAIKPGNGLLLWFTTEDFEAQLRRIKEHGIQLDRAPSLNPFSLCMECWLTDPDGYQVVIAGPSAREDKQGRKF